MGKRAKARSLTPVNSGANAEPIERRDLRQRVVGRIVELIRTGNLRPGDRLPPERELVDIFSISRPSLREAMRALSTLGIVESRHGGGTFVTDLDARTLLAPLDFFLQLSQVNLDDTFESRRVVEIEIVRKAAVQAKRDDIADLNDMIPPMPRSRRIPWASASSTAGSTRSSPPSPAMRCCSASPTASTTWTCISAAARPPSPA
ncbi:MAG: GntR family transcriptional regulator [Dongia sp.]